ERAGSSLRPMPTSTVDIGFSRSVTEREGCRPHSPVANIFGGKLGAGLPVQAHHEYNADEAWSSRKMRFSQSFRRKSSMGAMYAQPFVASFESLPLRFHFMLLDSTFPG